MADGRTGPRHEGLLAHARECGGVGRTHLVPGQDGEHGGCRSATTNAMATSVVCVKERWNCPGAACGGQRGRRPVEDDRRSVAGRAHPVGTAHLDLGERKTTEPGSERLHYGLLRCEARGQGLARIGRTAGVRLFGVGEEAGGKPGTARQHPPEPGHIDRIHADADHRRTRSASAAAAYAAAIIECGFVECGCIDPGPGGCTVAAERGGRHSTVTVLARLRGRSTSWPCRRARL